MSMSFKFNYIPYKINKTIVLICLPIKIIKIFFCHQTRMLFNLCVYSNLFIYVIVTRFLIIQYDYYFIIYVNEHTINNVLKIICTYNIHSVGAILT